MVVGKIAVNTAMLAASMLLPVPRGYTRRACGYFPSALPRHIQDFHHRSGEPA